MRLEYYADVHCRLSPIAWRHYHVKLPGVLDLCFENRIKSQVEPRSYQVFYG
jgi:hypothetical protein